MTIARPKPWTVDDFLAWEAQQEERYEFVDGIVFMMVGGSAAHAAIRDNVVAGLNGRIRDRGCRAYGEFKVRAAVDGLYPDVVVICGPLPKDDDSTTTPVMVVEVLSRSTEHRDRGSKWLAYQQLDTLRHYMLIAQDQRRVELYTRVDEGWLFRTIEPPETKVVLTGLGTELTLDEIYQDSGV